MSEQNSAYLCYIKTLATYWGAWKNATHLDTPRRQHELKTSMACLVMALAVYVADRNRRVIR